jgi:hypothetical protein
MVKLRTKHKKMELQMERDCDCDWYAAKEWTLMLQEWALVIQQQMQEKQFMHKEWEIKQELELARLKVGVDYVPSNFAFRKEDHSTNVCSSSTNNLPPDSFIFSAGAASSTTLPYLSSWGSGASVS